MTKNPQKKHIFGETIGAIFIIIFVSLFIVSNFFAGFIWPLYVLALLIGFFLSFRHPRSGLFSLVFLTIIFERFFTLQSFLIGKAEYKLYPLDIIIFGIIFGLLLSWLSGNLKKIHWKMPDFILAIFIFLNLAYFLFSVLFVQSSSYLAFSSLKNYAFYSLLYFLTFLLIRSEKDIQRLFRFFLSGAILVIGFILFGILNGGGLWTEYTPLSTSGVRILAFTHGLYLSLAFFPVVIFLIFQRPETAKYRNLFYFLLALWTLGIVGTMMRHIWIAMFIVLILLYFFIPLIQKIRLKKIIFGFLTVFAGALIFVFYFIALSPQSTLSTSTTHIFSAVLERTQSIQNANNDESFSWRNLVWNSAYQDYQKNPFLGIGTGKSIYVESENYQDFVEVRNIHNSYLAILIQLGILGLLVLLLFIYQIIRDLLRFQTRELAAYKFSFLSIISLYLIVLLFQPYLETNLLAIFFWITLGLARVLPEIAQEK